MDEKLKKHTAEAVSKEIAADQLMKKMMKKLLTSAKCIAAETISKMTDIEKLDECAYADDAKRQMSAIMSDHTVKIHEAIYDNVYRTMNLLVELQRNAIIKREYPRLMNKLLEDDDFLAEYINRTAQKRYSSKLFFCLFEEPLKEHIIHKFNDAEFLEKVYSIAVYNFVDYVVNASPDADIYDQHERPEVTALDTEVIVNRMREFLFTYSDEPYYFRNMLVNAPMLGPNMKNMIFELQAAMATMDKIEGNGNE